MGLMETMLAPLRRMRDEEVCYVRLLLAIHYHSFWAALSCRSQPYRGTFAVGLSLQDAVIPAIGILAFLPQ
ncbi:hypothetical protein M405DRAFT_811174 [Rhizopogon salebrosus TDB-379]|nr:hypothetical protein M405DRAFT_811174 [Rhizopogon salebrosus TDB-379]